MKNVAKFFRGILFLMCLLSLFPMYQYQWYCVKSTVVNLQVTLIVCAFSVKLKMEFTSKHWLKSRILCRLSFCSSIGSCHTVLVAEYTLGHHCDSGFFVSCCVLLCDVLTI